MLDRARLPASDARRYSVIVRDGKVYAQPLPNVLPYFPTSLLAYLPTYFPSS